MNTLDFYTQFECIGSRCEDTCCAGGVVTIDKQTYKEYQGISNSLLREKILKHINRNRQATSDDQYKVKLLPNNSCPYLDQENLCDIYKNCGESYLSKTCTVYPRTGREFCGVREYSMSLSCPEVARLALLRTDVIRMVETDEALCHSSKIKQMKVEELCGKYPQDYYEVFNSIRMLCFLSLQIRNLAIDERLFLIGFYLNKFNTFLAEKNLPGMNQAIIGFIDCSQSPAPFMVHYHQLDSDVNLKLKYFTNVLLTMLPVDLNKRLAECVGWFISGLELDREKTVDIDKVAEVYMDGYEKYYIPFIEENGHLIENYLVTHMFYVGFPFERGLNPLDNYLKFISSYTTIQTILVGIGCFHKGIQIEHFMQLIQSYEKFIAHNQEYLPQLISHLKENNFNTLPAMTVLIK